MARYGESAGRTKRVTIEPVITRAYWSTPRAYQEQKVKLFIETARMPEGAELKVEIRELGSDLLVDEPKGPFQVKGNRCSADYEIDWDEETLGHPLALETPRFQFYFRVIHEGFKLTRDSNPLYVDLHDFTLSS
jgi:hypothetical protein